MSWSVAGCIPSRAHASASVTALCLACVATDETQAARKERKKSSKKKEHKHKHKHKDKDKHKHRDKHSDRPKEDSRGHRDRHGDRSADRSADRLRMRKEGEEGTRARDEPRDASAREDRGADESGSGSDSS